MRYGSVCSGIEAATVAWHPLGWEAQWFSEIEPFPSAVLDYRFPNVPNLGDMTQIHLNPIFNDSTIDVLVGGTPCQSFSVAGLRKGLDDPRGNLMLTYLSLAERKKPQWIVWENVPGVLSSNGGRDFACFLDSLEELRYICDVEILDAQFFGVAQRRRRVFVCGQSVDSIMNQKTVTSGLTIAQCLTEILHSILIETLCLFERGRIKLEQANLSRDGVRRRMNLFGILTEDCNYKKWQQLLVDVFLKSVPMQKNWDLPHGGKTERELTLEDLLMASPTEIQSTLTEESLKKALEDLYDLMKLYTTSTLTKETIQSKIFLFFQIGEVIGRLICRLSGSSPNSLSATLSFLTLSQELTNYARQTSRELFSEMDGVYQVDNFVQQAGRREVTFGYLGDWRPAAAVLFESHSLQWNLEKSRKKGKETPRPAQDGIGESGAQPTHAFKIRGGSEVETGEQGGTPGKKAGKGYLGQDERTFTIGAVQDQMIAQPIALAENTIGRKPENGGNGDGFTEGGPMYTLNTTGVHGVGQPLPFNTTQITNPYNGNNPKYGDPCHTLASTDHPPAIAQPLAVDCYNQTVNEKTSQTIGSSASDVNHYGAVLQPTMAIRRLTPTECERLQGFPDSWTRIPYRNKPIDKCPDGPRYKACGNSMAVPVMHWIGKRIDYIANLLNETK